MSVVDLPSTPAPSVPFSVFLIDQGGYIEPILGGDEQRIDRLGNRYGASFTMPPMEHEDIGRIWVSKLNQAKTEGARMDYPLTGIDVGTPGSPVVDGGSQAGSEIDIRSGAASYQFVEGQPINIVTGGVYRLYFLRAAVTLDGTGAGTLPITPLLRGPPADGDTVEVASPKIEGRIVGEEMPWSVSLAHHTGLEFTIREIK